LLQSNDRFATKLPFIAPPFTLQASSTSPTAIDVVASSSRSSNDAAATAILDRAFGRPAQTLRAQNENQNVQYFTSDKPLTVEEWRRNISPEIETAAASDRTTCPRELGAWPLHFGLRTRWMLGE
jgi:hypothetical protein